MIWKDSNNFNSGYKQWILSMHLPSVTINKQTRLSVRRVLPQVGELLVQPGQAVNAVSVIGRTTVAERRYVIDVAQQLGVPNVEMDEVILVDTGDLVERGDIIASYKLPGTLFNKTVRTPASGQIAVIGPGWILLETEQTEVELQAFINGVVTRLIENRGVLIEANGARVEAVCGFGGEAYGKLIRVVNGPAEALTPDLVNENFSQSILLGGRTLDEETLYAAEAWNVHGIIVGSIPAALLAMAPPVKVRVVATEGFGDMAMSPYTFGVLTSLSRRDVSIRGQIPPPLGPRSSDPYANQQSVIMATDPLSSRGGYVTLPPAPPEEEIEAKVGSKVRIIQGEYLGSSGVIDLLPPEPQRTANGILTPGAYVKFNNDLHFIPWANMNLIK
jgi:hypothetical protein